MFHLVQYEVVGEAVPNGLLHLSLIISCHSLLFMKGCLLLEQNNSFAQNVYFFEIRTFASSHRRLRKGPTSRSGGFSEGCLCLL